MEFLEKLANFSNRIERLKDNIQTEEATKTSIILPFFQLLGYDVFNPLEFVPEFTADVGIKKGEKVDYAIMFNNEPLILIEAKPINTEMACTRVYLRHEVRFVKPCGRRRGRRHFYGNDLRTCDIQKAGR